MFIDIAAAKEVLTDEGRLHLSLVGHRKDYGHIGTLNIDFILLSQIHINFL